MTILRKILPLIAVLGFGLILGACTSSGEVTQDSIKEVYNDYRDGDKKALNNLISYYRDPALPKDLRKQALLKVIESNDPVGMQAIRNSLKDGEDIDYELFTTGIQALSRNRDVENIRTILQAMETHRQGYVSIRNEMFQIIEEQVDARSLALILKIYAEAKADYAAFLKNLTLTLGRIDDDRVVPVLMAVATNPKVDIGVRNLAVEILASKNDPAIATMLAEMLGNPRTQDQVRQFALSVTDEFKDERLIVALIEALHDERSTYYAMVDAITRSLGEFDDPKMKAALVTVAQDEVLPSRYRKRAIENLVKFEDPQVAASLVALLQNPDNFIFYHDIKSLVDTLDDSALSKQLQHVARATQAEWEENG